jgi:hypothetical protein
MDLKRLVSGYQSIMCTIYDPKEYYERALNSLKRTAHAIPEPTNYSGLYAVKAFTKIALKLGVLDSERKEFWRFFLKSVHRHRSRFAESLRLAAMGYHFRKLNDSFSDGMEGVTQES